MNVSKTMRIIAAALLLATFAIGTATAADHAFTGAAKCKTCHNKPAEGAQYDQWMSTKHAKAFATLASDESKAIAKEKGIADPQTADACLKCHVTGHGAAAALLGEKYAKTEGVTCEIVPRRGRRLLQDDRHEGHRGRQGRRRDRGPAQAQQGNLREVPQRRQPDLQELQLRRGDQEGLAPEAGASSPTTRARSPRPRSSDSGAALSASCPIWPPVSVIIDLPVSNFSNGNEISSRSRDRRLDP